MKIVIIGNSAAGFSCCQHLLHRREAEISVITQESCPAYKKVFLLDYLGGKVSREEIFLCPPEFYLQNKINLLANAKVTRVDTRKQQVVLKDNTKISYDYLVIASGQKAVLPDIPGTNKDGVFTVNTLEDIDKILPRLEIANLISISGDADNAARLAGVFAEKNKEIKVISAMKPEWFSPNDLTEWISGYGLGEIIGEGLELKAIKLSNGKAFAVDMVLFTGNYLPSTEFLKDSGVKVEKNYVTVDSSMRTNFENIFSCGACARFENFLDEEKDWADVEKEGILAANKLTDLLERGSVSCQPTS